MGIKVSLDCCSCSVCTTGLDDDEYKSEDDMNTWKEPCSFRTDYYSMGLSSRPVPFFITGEEEKIDFISDENRIIQCSAILGATEIPEIPNNFS